MRLRSVVVTFLLVVGACTGAAEETTTTGEDPVITEPPVGTSEPAPTTTLGGGGGEAAITISGFSFGAPITVSVGETVTVTNTDPFQHTWTSDDNLWDSGVLGSDETFAFTFEEAGTFSFFCRIHPNEMMGSITVEG